MIKPSNHLDVECIDCLGDALSSWGDEEGALVVISHDRSFCEKIGFTHVGTVKDGSFVLEERSLCERDWERYDLGSKEVDGALVSSGQTSSEDSSPLSKEEESRLRKLAYNAPKRIKKIETLVEKCEEEIASIDNDMIEFGTDFGKLKVLMKDKEEKESKLEEYMIEWEELETVLAQYSK